MNDAIEIDDGAGERRYREVPANRSVTVFMSEKYGMDPLAFEATVRATCSPKDRNGQIALTREEFAAFLLVAKEYGLNPLTKEIFAFPAKGGGIVPVVSVDGWINLINSKSECDGWDFETERDDEKKLVAITCRMHRKDRSHPVVVTEYLSECRRDTDPWKGMPNRMLRHKALIQAGRYAFGFAGIYDEDEAERIAGVGNNGTVRDVTPARAVAPPPPAAPPPMPPAVPTIEHKPAVAMDVSQERAAEVVETKAAAPAVVAPPPAPTPPDARAVAQEPAAETWPQRLARFIKAAGFAESIDALNAAYEAIIGEIEETLSDDERDDALSAFRRREHELEE